MANYSSSASIKLSFEEIIKRANAKITVISAVQTETKPTTSKPKLGYPTFQPDTTPDITDKQLCSSLLEVKKESPSGVNKGQKVAVVKPAVALKIPGTSQTWKLTLPNTRHRPDFSMYDKLKIAGLNRYADPTTLLYRSNGTKTALLKRLRSKLIPDCKNNPVKFRGIVLFDRHKFEKTISSKSEIVSKINPHATAGLPYAFFPDKGLLPNVDGVTFLPVDYHTTGEAKTTMLTKPMPILLHAIDIAHKMFHKIVDDASTFEELNKNARAFFLEHPELNTFILKRKDERMERTDFYEKVRPYGAQPFPTRLFSMWAVKPLEDNIASFAESHDSISAYHYSPFYGGVNKIIEHFVYHKNKNFSGLAYGDDQLWQIKLSDGTTVMMAPDVSAMDMSTSNSCINDIVKFLYENPVKFEKNNLFALYLSLSLAFKHDIHIGGPYIVSKLHSLLSGIPGTTIINIFNSARIQTLVEDVFNENQPITKAKFFPTLAKALSVVKSNLGYTFKGYESLVFDVAQKPQNDQSFEDFIKLQSSTMIYTTVERIQKDGIRLPFLSNIIAPFTMDGVTKLISIPSDLNKLGSTLVLPDSRSLRGSQQNKITLERIAGAYVTGGWIDEDFSDFLHAQYKALGVGVNIEKFSLTDFSTIGEEDIIEMLSLMVRPSLPSRQFMFDFNTMDRESFVLKYSSSPSAIYDENSINSIIPSSKDEIVYPTYNNINDTVDQNDVDELDKIITFDKDKIVDPKKMNVQNANTLVKEKAKIDRLEKLKMRRKAEEDSLASMVKSKSTKKKIGSLLNDALNEMDDEDRVTKMEMYYEAVDAAILDEDGEEDEIYKCLKDTARSFYKEWDVYEEEDNVSADDQDYYSSEYGKFTDH